MGDKDFVAPPGFTAAKIFDDPTPNAVINQRIMLTFTLMAGRHTNLTQQEGNQFLNILLLIGRKMVSTWKHLAAYHAEEDRLVAEFAAAGDSARHFDFSQTLFDEFDQFTVQIKSTLDHLVKVMLPVLGQRKWTPRTFGSKGEKVLNALRNTGRQYEGRVRSMEYLLFNDEHKAWLEAVIHARDRANHFLDGGFPPETFAVLRRPDGTIEVPMWSKDQKLADAMDAVWGRFLSFVEDFIAMALNFRMPEDTWSIFKKPEPANSHKSPWRVVPKADADAFIKRFGATPL